MNITKCIIFGIGKHGKIACELLNDKYEIICFADNNKLKWGGEFEGRKVISPDDILLYAGVEVVIANKRNYNDIWKQLEKRGVAAKVFLPYYDIECRQRKYRLIGLKDCCKDFASEIGMPFTKVDFPAASHTKKILLVSNYFPPIGGIAVQRVVCFAKFLKKYGYEVIVLTKGFVDADEIRDESLNSDVKGIPVIRIQDYPVLFEEFDEKNLLQILTLYKEIVNSEEWMKAYQNMQPLKLLPDDNILWVYLCLKLLAKKVALNEISCMLTTVGSFSLSILGFFLKKEYGIKWVLDYRDAWCLNEYVINTYSKTQSYYKELYPILHLAKELEIKLVKSADYVVCAEEALCNDILSNTGNKRVKCITNGYREADFSGLTIHKKKYFEMVFNGTVYTHCNFLFLLDVINELIDTEQIQKNTIKLSFNGVFVDNMQRLNLQNADKYGVVSINGHLPHKVSLQSAYNADILVVFGAYNDGAYYVYTGKIFEYLRLGRPVLSFSSPFGLHYEMLEKRNRGMTATYDDKEKICTFILKHYNYWKENGRTEQYEIDDYVKSFNREKLTEELAKVLDETLTQ